MIRKSKMVIYTRPFHFSSNYSGVFICDNDHGNKELRKMESPEHDRWDKDRYKEKGSDIENELKYFIRNSLKSLTKLQESKLLEIPGLQKYLPFNVDDNIPGSNGNRGGYTGKVSELESSKESGKSEEFDEDILITPYKISVLNTPLKGIGGDGTILRKTSKKRKLKDKKGGGEKGDEDALLASQMKSRIFLKKQESNILEYRVIIKSEINGKCNLKLFAVGEEGAGKIKIIEAIDEYGNRYATNGHRIMRITLNQEGKLLLDIRVLSSIKLSLKLEGYGLQQ
jgi:hypothetical protein